MHNVVGAAKYHKLNWTSDGKQRHRALVIAGLVVLLVTTVYLVSTGRSKNRSDDIGLTHDGDEPSGPKISKSTGSAHVNLLNIGMGCPEFQTAFDSAVPGSNVPFRSFTLTKGTGYAYVALHLSKLWMPRGASVVLRAVEGFDSPDRTLNLTANYKSGRVYKNISAPPVLAKEFRIEFYRDEGSINTTMADQDTDTFDITDDETKCFGFVVSSYHYVLMDDSNPISATDESICAADNTKEAICYYADPTTRTTFLAARSVARLRIPKGPKAYAGCTGWLLGNQGHIMTNYHCVATDAEASATTVEFMAEADICSDSVSCTSWGACPGDTVAVSVELIHADEGLDYALIKLPSDGAELAQKYGYLRMKNRPGVVGEQLYIPQHPLYHGKRIALVDDYTSNVALLSLHASSCGGIGYSYSGDTQSGSSGSPVLSHADHGVVALHHCGEMCANTGVPAMRIVSDLMANDIDVAEFDGLDDGSNATANIEKFPDYTPPAPEAVLPLTPRLTFDGAIVYATGYVSIDTVAFTLTSDADVSFDVTSVEIADNDTYYDLNGDCLAAYLDSMIFLFPSDDPTPIFTVDDSQVDEGIDDGSVSYRDPYKATFLKKGSYILAIAPTGASEEDALAGKTKADYPPELYTCRTRGSYGAYKLQISSTIGVSPFQFSALPTPVGIDRGLCHETADEICSS